MKTIINTTKERHTGNTFLRFIDTTIDVDEAGNDIYVPVLDVTACEYDSIVTLQADDGTEYELKKVKRTTKTVNTIKMGKGLRVVDKDGKATFSLPDNNTSDHISDYKGREWIITRIR